MKKYLLLSLLILFSSNVFSQCGFTMNANNPAYCGTINVSVSGGIAPFTYQLNNGVPQAGGTFVGVPAGTYTIYVTDSSPCMDSMIVVSAPGPPISFNITTTTSPSCVPGCDGAAATSTIGGVPPFTYSIFNGGVVDTVGNCTYLCANTSYTIQCADANGCTITTTVNLAQPGNPILTVSNITNVTCNGLCDGTAQLSGVGGAPSYIYSITAPGVINVNTGAVNGLCAGNYTATLTDANSCIGTTAFAITEPQMLVVNVNPATTPTCVPGCDATANATAIGGTPPYSYSITGGALIDINGNSSNLCAGVVYTITASDANACWATTTIQFVGPNSPILSVNAVTPPSCVPGCDGTVSTISVGGLPAYTYNITGGAIIDILGNAFGLCGGTVYTITITDANACSGSTTAQLANPPNLTMNLVNVTSPICNGLCTGSAQANVVGGTPPYSYSLYPAMAAIQNNGSIIGACAGTYTVLVIDASGCSATAMLNISEPMPLSYSNVNFSNPTCVGVTDGIITVTAIGGTPPTYYSILPVVGIQNQPGIFSNLLSSQYTIVATDANGCIATTIVVLGLPSLNFSITTINNLSCTCVGSIGITNVMGGNAPFTYAISPAANQPIVGTFDNMCGGIYTITVTDANTCTGTSIFNFNQIQLTANSTNSQCNGVNNGSINCTALFGTPPYSFTLNPGNVINGIGVFNNLAAGTYTIHVSDANLCSNTITSIIIDTSQIIVSVIGIDSIICGAGGNASFQAYGNAVGPFTYTVQPGNIANNNGIFNSLNAATYTLTVSNIAGCVKSDTFDIVQVSAILPITVTSTVYDETCHLAGDGAIDIVPANPNGLTYLWNNGAIAQDLVNVNSGSYQVKISNANGDCLNVLNTVSAQGLNCGTISGNIYYDGNSSCINDANDYNLPNISVQLSNGALAFTNMSGNYQFSNVPYGNYSLTHNFNGFSAPNACAQPSALVLNAINNNLSNNDFKDTSNVAIDLGVYIYSNPIVPGFNTASHINVWNASANPQMFNLSFLLSNPLVLNVTMPMNQGVYPIANADSIVWSNVTINPYTNLSFHVISATPANIPLGTNIISTAEITPINFVDANPNNNVYSSPSVVVGAFDPNDKSVNPIGEGPTCKITLQDSILNYQIRFQNTGTDSAHNIYILDTLSDKLDIHTLKVTGFSHPYKIEILNGNILKFKFDNIMLPDSNVNEPLSHGYIAYSIEQKNTNQIGDVINNTAAIYFDFNAPIITNTTINTIAFPTNVTSQELDKEIKVYPNPAKDKLTIEFNSNSLDQSVVTLCNTLGQVVKTVIAKTTNGKNTIELTVKELPKGVYLLKLRQGKSQSMKKVMIE